MVRARADLTVPRPPVRPLSLPSPQSHRQCATSSFTRNGVLRLPWSQSNGRNSSVIIHSLLSPALLSYLAFFVRPPSHANCVDYALLQYVPYFDTPHSQGFNSASTDVTLAQGGDSHWKHWNPLSTPTFQPPSNFSDQLSDRNSPLFIDTNISNTLFTLPQNATSGISSFAYTVGLRPQDLFPVCLILFLSITAVTVVLSLFIWALDSAVTFIIHVRFSGPPKTQYGPTRHPHYANKDSLDHGALSMQTTADEEHTHHSSHFLFKSSKFTQSPPTRWFRLRPDFSSFHFTVLQGNLVRILMLFHLPVTIFSSYQLTIGREATALSIAFAALSLVAFSIVIPILLIFRLFMNSTSKLYDETWTLLSLGPLYNHYRHGSQLFACIFFATSLALGVTVGCGQKSGIAQAVVILLVEVITALVTSVWLPWGHGASMGLIGFLFCVARIVVAVLLVTLTPTVSACDLTSLPDLIGLPLLFRCP